MPGTNITTHRRQAQSRQLVSARRGASYERIASASVLPEQFLDCRVKLAAVCPETALMYAVLEDAFLCFHKHFEMNPRFIERAREAQEYRLEPLDLYARSAIVLFLSGGSPVRTSPDGWCR